MTPPLTAAHGTKMSCYMTLGVEINKCGHTTHMGHESIGFDIA